jgi:hypothetical protein
MHIARDRGFARGGTELSACVLDVEIHCDCRDPQICSNLFGAPARNEQTEDGLLSRSQLCTVARQQARQGVQGKPYF